MRLPPFPPLVWIVILGTFMVRTSFFMVWPFLSILLYREYGLSASGIGMLLGGAAVLSCLIGFYVGWLSDRLGRRTILLLGCALSCGAYLLLGFGHSLWLITLGVFGSGLSYAFIDTPGKALMGDLLPEKALRELALHLRYFLLNVGAGVGPLIGVMVGLGARQETFVVTAASYGLLGIAFLLGFRRDCANRPDAGLSLGAMLRVVGRDRAFMLFILANLLMNLVYAQVESPLIQYLTRAGAPEVETLVALLVATNALTIITLQFPLLHLTRRWRVSLRLQFSILLMASAQVMFALSSVALAGGDVLAERGGGGAVSALQRADRPDGAGSPQGELLRRQRPGRARLGVLAYGGRLVLASVGWPGPVRRDDRDLHAGVCPLRDGSPGGASIGLAGRLRGLTRSVLTALTGLLSPREYANASLHSHRITPA